MVKNWSEEILPATERTEKTTVKMSVTSDFTFISLERRSLSFKLYQLLKMRHITEYARPENNVNPIT